MIGTKEIFTAGAVDWRSCGRVRRVRRLHRLSRLRRSGRSMASQPRLISRDMQALGLDCYRWGIRYDQLPQRHRSLLVDIDDLLDELAASWRNLGSSPQLGWEMALGAIMSSLQRAELKLNQAVAGAGSVPRRPRTGYRS
jgi:hypothetical protein